MLSQSTRSPIMNRTLIAFILCSLSALHASGYQLESPTAELQQNNVERVHTRIQDAILKKAQIKGQLAMLDPCDQVKQEILSAQNVRALTHLKKKIKHLKREEKRLLSLQIN